MPSKKKKVVPVSVMAKTNNNKQKIKPTVTSSSAVNRARVGQIIVLKGGRTKNKRRYNEKQAIVKEIPLKGCWMTVKLIQQQPAQKQDETALTTLKWHKSSFHPMSTTDHRTDPLMMLNDESVSKIFSFLMGECPRDEDAKGQTLWLRKVIQSNQTMMMSVSPLWRQTFTRILPQAIGLIDVDLYTIEPWVSYMVHWLGKNNRDIKLSSLLVRFAELGDTPYLTQLINSCNTKHLTKMELSINKGRAESTSFSSYRLKKKKSRSSSRGNNINGTTVDVISLTDRPIRWRRDKDIHVTQLKDLHTLVANKCPNLVELNLSVTVPLNRTDYYDDYISTELFSKPTIQVLTISLGFCVDTTENRAPYRWDNNLIDSLVVTKVIKNLSGLKTLKLTSPTAASRDCYMRRFHVESTSLEHIDVTGLGKKMMVSCACPKLQSYKCYGHPYGNGTLPILTQSQFDNLDDYLVDSSDSDGAWGYPKDLVVKAGTYHFPHFVVPDNCQMSLLRFHPHLYNSDIAQHEANATFQTF